MYKWSIIYNTGCTSFHAPSLWENIKKNQPNTHVCMFIYIYIYILMWVYNIHVYIYTLHFHVILVVSNADRSIVFEWNFGSSWDQFIKCPPRLQTLQKLRVAIIYFNIIQCLFKKFSLFILHFSYIKLL